MLPKGKSGTEWNPSLPTGVSPDVGSYNFVRVEPRAWEALEAEAEEPVNPCALAVAEFAILPELLQWVSAPSGHKPERLERVSQNE